MNSQLFSEGAEAKLFKLNETTLQKVRLAKPYRIKELDTKLRRFRTRREFKVLTKLKKLAINAPEPYELNDKDYSFTFEFIHGNILKEVLTKDLLNKAFNNIIELHKEDIVHGDLTTLNMLKREKEVFLIDFGLSKFSSDIEEKAVDLNLFFTCINNEHPKFSKEKENLLKTYEKKIERGKIILERLEKVEKRGRNK